MSQAGPNAEAQRPSDEDADSMLDELVEIIEIPMMILALVSLTLIVIEFTAKLTPEQSRRISFAQSLIWGVFVLEFVLRVFLAENRKKYLRRHWLDGLIAFIPFLRILRVVRAARALRLLRFVRPAPLARTFFTTRRTLSHLRNTLARSSFQYVLLTTVVVVTLGSAGVLVVERTAGRSNIKSYGDALWYVTGVVTTIGNELYPVTAEGRILAAILMVYGVGVFGYIAGTLASYFVKADIGPGIQALPEENPDQPTS